MRRTILRGAQCRNQRSVSFRGCSILFDAFQNGIHTGQNARQSRDSRVMSRTPRCHVTLQSDVQRLKLAGFLLEAEHEVAVRFRVRCGGGLHGDHFDFLAPAERLAEIVVVELYANAEG